MGRISPSSDWSERITERWETSMSSHLMMEAGHLRALSKTTLEIPGHTIRPLAPSVGAEWGRWVKEGFPLEERLRGPECLTQLCSHCFGPGKRR